ncbi:uncharacterized protein LOC117265575 isoform X2 [Epinephelus lanceolatus]
MVGYSQREIKSTRGGGGGGLRNPPCTNSGGYYGGILQQCQHQHRQHSPPIVVKTGGGRGHRHVSGNKRKTQKSGKHRKELRPATANMEYKRNCSTTHNAVCGCKAGYACRDPSCKDCVPIPTSTIKTTLPPSTAALKPGALTTLWEPSQPIKDTAWFLVIIALLCIGLALVVLTKIKPFLRWIKSKQGYFLAKEAAPVLQGSEDEEVSTPVQEVLGKCDQCDV